MYTRNKYQHIALASLAILLLVVAACKKQDLLGEDPYAGGKVILPITFVTKSDELTEASANASVTLKVNGLQKLNQTFKLYVNEIEATVNNFTDTSINFNVPIDASTGSVWITAQDQTFFGPILKIAGKVSFDTQFGVVSGAGNVAGTTGATTIFDVEKLASGLFWLGGSFNSFDGKGTTALPNGGIVQLAATGAYSTSGVAFGRGVGGNSSTIYSIAKINSGTYNGKYIIAGSFASFNSIRPNRQTLNNVARLNVNGSLDTVTSASLDANGNSLVPIVNPKPAETYKNGDTVSAFNAGVDGAVRKVFTFNDQVYLIGNFNNFKRMYLPNSTYDEKVYDLTKMRQLVRVNVDGTMDSTFHFNKNTRQSATAGNGAITDAFMQADGKLILVGNFNTFNGTAANHIVRLNLDGSIDNTFQVGTGADDDIYSISYNASTNKIALSGSFKTFNGKPAAGVNLINADGSNVSTFVPQTISGGTASFVGQLSNGKLLVAGSFNKYGAYLRQGFMVLNADGSLAAGYNNTGGFQGRIFDMSETVVAGSTQVVLVGEFHRFNTALPNNVMRVIISN